MNSAARSQAPQQSIHPATTMGAVSLRVADLARSREFYERVLGLRADERDDGGLSLGGGGEPLVVLHGDSSAPPLDHGAPGLFHLAVLMPDRPSLARALARLASAGWPLDGASDHLVSEALYLSDPDGNGIEIYSDRPREDWGRRDGQLEMATLPLDTDSLLGELSRSEAIEADAPAGTRMGHVHLQVADLAAAEEFYSGVLGFDVTVRGYPGALFVSAGGYHHHLGLNTWNVRADRPRNAASVGLAQFEIVVPDEVELDRLVAQVGAAQTEIRGTDGGWITADPSGNQLLLRAA